MWKAIEKASISSVPAEVRSDPLPNTSFAAKLTHSASWDVSPDVVQQATSDAVSNYSEWAGCVFASRLALCDKPERSGAERDRPAAKR